MSRVARPFLLILALACPGHRALEAAPPDLATASGPPDPAAVERYGPAYRYPKAGWIVLHVEGKPYDRGYQHGRLLAPEIADYLKALASRKSPKSPGDAWRAQRTTVNALFLRRYDQEYLEEMKGIADGAADAGARFDDRPLDLLDLVAVNSEIEVDFLDAALEATPNGLEGRKFAAPSDDGPRPPRPEHCSAFAATGPATADGSIVFGHITMFDLFFVRHFNVWLDVKPAEGHRILMQTYPGGIQSGMDYYLNDAGLLVAETTISQTRFDIEGKALASRIRKALQYAGNIDEAVAILSESNNGMYTNEWLLADVKTGEIAMFELGTRRSKLWRSSRDEWFGGTRGFYWGCNNTKDLEVRLETVASLSGKPANVVFHPSDRDRAWLRLFEKSRGKIAAGFGFEAFSTPRLVASSSCDAKFTTSALARHLKTWALFGPPLGRTWEPSQSDRERNADVRPLVGNDWTVLGPELPPPPGAKARPAVDLASSKPSRKPAAESRGPSPRASVAWHGTILPRNDADTWLAAAFADYEKDVSEEKALRSSGGGKAQESAEKDRLDLLKFAHRSRYLVAAARLGHDVPLAETRSAMDRDEWYDIASGKGSLLLGALRASLGHDAFVSLMDDFGKGHAGRRVGTDEFLQAVEALPGKSLKPRFFDAWLKEKGIPDDPGGGSWSTDAFEDDLDRTLIVYGTLKDESAQREAAEILQRQVARRWSNVTIPIRSDLEAAADLAADHLLLVGRPDTNAVVARFAGSLPIRFGPGSFSLKGETYAHPASAVIVAASHPLNPRREVVVFAGLGAEATRQCVQSLGTRGARPAEAILLASGERARRLVLPAGSPTPVRSGHSPEAVNGRAPAESSDTRAPGGGR